MEKPIRDRLVSNSSKLARRSCFPAIVELIRSTNPWSIRRKPCSGRVPLGDQSALPWDSAEAWKKAKGTRGIGPPTEPESSLKPKSEVRGMTPSVRKRTLPE